MAIDEVVLFDRLAIDGAAGDIGGDVEEAQNRRIAQVIDDGHFVRAIAIKDQIAFFVGLHFDGHPIAGDGVAADARSVAKA